MNLNVQEGAYGNLSERVGDLPLTLYLIVQEVVFVRWFVINEECGTKYKSCFFGENDEKIDAASWE